MNTHAAATRADVRLPGLPAGTHARSLTFPADLPAMAELVASSNRVDRHDWYPSPEVLAIQWGPTSTFQPERDSLVVVDDAGMAAMVSVDPHVRDGKVVYWTEGWVRPDRRRQGIGTALLRWSEEHAAEIVRTRAIERVDLPQFIGFGALEENPAAMGFASWSGYERIRYGFLMRRDLTDPIPEFALPEGIELRPVRPEDHRRIFEADTEAFLDHFEPRERDESDFVATFTAPHVETDLWRVAWAGDEVAGLVMNQIDPEENARAGLEIGWLEHVSVRRPFRRRGLASALIVASLHALRERGMDIASLGVDGQNLTGALRLYERLGFQRHRTWITYRKPLPAVEGGSAAT